MLDEKEVASLSLVDAVVHHASLAQRPTQTKVESTGGQPTSSDSERTTEQENVAIIKQENTGTDSISLIWNDIFYSRNVYYRLTIDFQFCLFVTIEPMDIDRQSSSIAGSTSTLDIPSSKVTVLRGHQSEVFTCAWSPEGDNIVSG